MRLEIDTAQKTIRINGRVDLGELFIALADMLPDGRWKEFTLIPEYELTTSPWQAPPTIQPLTQPYTQPLGWPQQWPGSTITFHSGTGSPLNLNDGVTVVDYVNGISSLLSVGNDGIITTDSTGGKK